MVAAYSGFEAGTVDSVSVLRLTEHLGQLTSRDLRNLDTKVPLETLKVVVDMAVEIGREGEKESLSAHSLSLAMLGRSFSPVTPQDLIQCVDTIVVNGSLTMVAFGKG